MEAQELDRDEMTEAPQSYGGRFSTFPVLRFEAVRDKVLAIYGTDCAVGTNFQDATNQLGQRLASKGLCMLQGDWLKAMHVAICQFRTAEKVKQLQSDYIMERLTELSLGTVPPAGAPGVKVELNSVHLERLLALWAAHGPKFAEINDIMFEITDAVQAARAAAGQPVQEADHGER